jgi:amidase
VGTETDGSVVSPAAQSGIVGLKPTVGLVSRTGIIPISHNQDTAGPMARTVTDTAALLGAMAGVDPEDPATKDAAPKIEKDYTRFLDANSLKGARLGVVRKYAGFSLDVDRVFDEAIAVLKKSGAEIIDPVEIPTIGKFDEQELLVLLYDFKNDLNAYFQWLGAGATVKSMKEVIEFNERHADRELKYFGQDLMIQAEAKGPLTSEEYLKALADCRRMSREEGIDGAMDRLHLDALIAPTQSPAWTTDLVNGDHTVGGSSTLPAVAGYPHITVPMGLVWDLPAGLSFFGRAWTEGKLISVAYAYEQASKMRKLPRFIQRLPLP